MAEDEIQDSGSMNKYFSMMLHIDDDDLDPFEYKLLGHYRKICGLYKRCTEAVSTTAKRAGMSQGKVREARESLQAKGCIRVDSSRVGETVRVTISDRMEENLKRYSQIMNPSRIHEGGSIENVSPPLTDSVPNIRIEEGKNIPTPAKSAKGFMRLPKSKTTSRDDVSYESDDAKTTYKPSALELVIRAEFPGIKSIPKASLEKLGRDSAPHLSSIQYTAPDDMYERYPLYAQWLEEKILAYFRTLPDAKDYRAGPKHLINLICRPESLTDPKHGFLIYQNTFTAMKLASELQQRQAGEMINKIQSDGTGEVPGWMRDASELDDSVFD